MAAAALALILANGPLGDGYRHLLHVETGPVLSPQLGPMTVHLWINDGLMALFFLLVGLEIKREFVEGQLATWERRRLPVIAAAAGMAVPALLYLIIAGGTPELARGWAIPAATDIAFAIAVLGLAGSRVPTSLKLFLTAIAIADDLGAVAIIAIFYTGALNLAALAIAAAVLAGLWLMGRRGIASLWPYLAGAALLWYFILLSGVHATVAGVLAAAVIPLRREGERLGPAPAGTWPRALGRLPHRAPVRLRQCGSLLRGLRAGNDALAAAARHRPWSVCGQADRHLRRGPARRRRRHRGPPARRRLAAALRRRPALRRSVSR